MKDFVTVRLFASLRDIAGRATIEIPLGPQRTAAAVREGLIAMLPAAAALIGRSALAVNEAYVAADHALNPGDTLAIIPPVSGG